MRHNIRIHFLNVLLILTLLLAAYSLYAGYQTQKIVEEESASVEEEYDYDAVRELVSLPTRPPLKAQPESESIPTYDTQEMLSINPDFKGWLWIPDTDVSYPVVQAADNDTYLKRSFQGTYSAYGSLFLDKDSVSGSRSRVIHGHNMGNTRTEMFSSLVNYQDPEWAGERTNAYFIEPDSTGNSHYQLFAVLNFSVNDLDDFNYFQTDFETEEDFHAFAAYLKARSLYDTEYVPEDELLILSTCNRYYGNDNRLLVCFGRCSIESN